MKRPGLLLGLLATGALLSACSLAGDVTPPPGARSFSVDDPTPIATAAAPEPAPIDVSLVEPARRPSLVAGQALYADRCADCHGATGLSDGVFVADLPAPPPLFAEADTLREQTPREVFATVTQGRMDKFMPPFSEALTDAQRWDVAAFVYTLSTPADELAAGGEVYAASCAECHGVDGSELRDWTSPTYFAEASPARLYAAITDGVPEAEEHAFVALSDAERWATIAYVRSLTYDTTAPLEPETIGAQGAVSGAVTNGTPGAAIPEALIVTLYGFTDMSVATTLTTTIDADGRFAFAEVPYTPETQFILAADYQGTSYHSDVVAFAGDVAQLDVSLPIYETTEDPAALRIEQLHTFVMFETPGVVSVAQMAVFSNDGDRTYAPSSGQSVRFAVPAEAAGLFSPEGIEGETYYLTPEGYADGRPVPPGEATLQVFYQYTLPYTDQLSFAQPIGYPVGEANLLVGDAEVSLNGAGLEDQGVQTIQGLTFQQFSRTGLAAGESLAFEMSGGVAVAAEDGAAGTNTLTGLASDDPLTLGLGLGALVAVAGGIGWWWYRGRAGAAPAGSGQKITQEDWLQAIAELDDDYAAGKVTAAEYKRERAWLLSELQRVWRPDDQA